MIAQESKGFEITLHDAQHIVRIRTWGCWDVELAKTYRGALREKIKEICDNDKQWGVLVDVTSLSPRSEDVQWMIDEPLAPAGKQGIKKLAYLGTKPAVQLRLTRRFRETDIPRYAFFKSQDEALRWLLSK